MISRPRITDEELAERGYARLYSPPVNETHLADYALVPVDRLWEKTKNLIEALEAAQGYCDPVDAIVKEALDEYRDK